MEDADFSLRLQPLWLNAVAPHSLWDITVSPLTIAQCVCWGAQGKRASRGGAHLTVAYHKTWLFGVSAPFQYPTDGVFKDNRGSVWQFGGFLYMV